MTAISDEAKAALADDSDLRENLARLPEPSTAPPAAEPPTAATRSDAADLPGADALGGAGALLTAGPGPDAAQFMNFQGATGTGNTCGQAAIASLARYYHVNLGNMGPGAWPNDMAINQVIADGFKPDVVAGAFGTTGGTIALALQHYGLSSVSCGYVGVGGVACQGGWSWQQCWQTVKQWVNAGHPVPVLVSAASVGIGLPVQGHWPVVLRVVEGSHVTLGNCRGYGQGSNYLLDVPEATFLDGWNFLGGTMCGFSHCFVVGSGRH